MSKKKKKEQFPVTPLRSTPSIDRLVNVVTNPDVVKVNPFLKNLESDIKDVAHFVRLTLEERDELRARVTDLQETLREKVEQISKLASANAEICLALVNTRVDFADTLKRHQAVLRLLVGQATPDLQAQYGPSVVDLVLQKPSQFSPRVTKNPVRMPVVVKDETSANTYVDDSVEVSLAIPVSAPVSRAGVAPDLTQEQVEHFLGEELNPDGDDDGDTTE